MKGEIWNEQFANEGGDYYNTAAGKHFDLWKESLDKDSLFEVFYNSIISDFPKLPGIPAFDLQFTARRKEKSALINVQYETFTRPWGSDKKVFCRAFLSADENIFNEVGEEFLLTIPRPFPPKAE